MKPPRLLACLVSLGLLAACSGAGEEDAAGDRAGLRSAAMAFDSALSHRDLDAILSFISDETLILPDGGRQISGIDNIRPIMDRAVNRRGFQSEAEAPRIGMGASGGYGYSLTNVTRTYERSDGTLSIEHYRDLHVWQRQFDGSWKIVIDIWNGLPEASAGSK